MIKMSVVGIAINFMVCCVGLCIFLLAVIPLENDTIIKIIKHITWGIPSLTVILLVCLIVFGY